MSPTRGASDAGPRLRTAGGEEPTARASARTAVRREPTTDAVVLHQPATHPYVAALQPAAAVADVPDVWDVASWGGRRVDVVHVHFGFEHLSRESLAHWLDAVRRRGTAVVYTLHDLDNPHLVDQAHHRALVASLVAAADHVFTLTEAVAQSARRLLPTERRIEVAPHPSLLPPNALRAHSRGDGIYVHAATVRPNFDADLLADLADAAVVAGVALDVHVRRGAALPPTVLARIGRAGARVRHEPRLTDEQLNDRIRRAALLAVPYRWGSHSGLVELAKDLGTTPLAPDVGGLLEQGAAPLDPTDLAGSITRATQTRPATTSAARAEERRRLVARHRRVYERVAS